MYLRYYGFKDYPFSVTPDPGFLYLSVSHREALGHLLYGAGERGGFVALIGEVGTGKTTLIRALVDSDMPDLDIALCWNPRLKVDEFVATICDELGVDRDPRADDSLKVLVDRLNAHLLQSHANNRRTVLIIDEAQNLSRSVLEQLRMLTNLETHRDKLLRVILVGQPELSDLLARHDLRQLSQRITARFRLQPLGLSETRAYVRHRLDRAGGSQHLFSWSAIVALQGLTRGVPRLINIVCDRALMGGYARSRPQVGPWMIWRSVSETLPRRPRAQWLHIAVPTGALAVVAVVVALAWLPNIPLSRAADWIHRHGVQTASAAQGDKPAAEKKPSGKIADGAHADAAKKAEEKKPSSKPPVAKAGGSDAADSGKTEDKQASADAGKAPKAASAADAGSGDKSKQADKKSREIPKGNADINQLLRLWGVFGSQIQSSCASLHVGDLRCLADRGSFSMIERYNRPALLVLQRGDHRQTVLLSAINGDMITLVGGNATHQVSRAKLLKHWTGRFEIVWRADSGVRLIEPGAVGNDVVWLRRRLVQTDGKNPDTKLGPQSPVYDDALEVRLKHFQLAHGLRPDGMAGPRTQIMLNDAVSSPGSPRLKKPKS